MMSRVMMDDIVGKRVAKVHQFGSHRTTFIVFDDDTFAYYEPKMQRNYGDTEAFIVEPEIRPADWPYSLVELGIATKEEVEADISLFQSQADWSRKNRELETLARLKAKYEKKDG